MISSEDNDSRSDLYRATADPLATQEMRARKALPPLPTERNRMLVPTNDGKAQSILSKVEPNEE